MQEAGSRCAGAARLQAPHIVRAAHPRRRMATASRASGFVLQSADIKSVELKPVSYLDSQ